MLSWLFSDANAWTVIWIAAIVSSVVGFGFLIHSSYIAGAWGRAPGHVVGNQQAYSQYETGRTTVYFAQIMFRVSDGTAYTVKSDMGRVEPWPLGDVVRVYYKPGNPRHAMTMKLWERLAFSSFFIGAGALCWALIAGVVSR